ncbi:MAG: hypothetical protein JEZ07_15740 [Phycisphaerae bacterium]|nr:hypothetical protein [Phycisphaerae bacterium]
MKKFLALLICMSMFAIAGCSGDEANAAGNDSACTSCQKGQCCDTCKEAGECLCKKGNCEGCDKEGCGCKKDGGCCGNKAEGGCCSDKAKPEAVKSGCGCGSKTPVEIPEVPVADPVDSTLPEIIVPMSGCGCGSK